MIAGIGRRNVRLIDVDEKFAMKPQALAAAIREDRAAGHTPCFICATVGTTSSHALDPLGPIGEIAQREKLYLHVDAAEAGSALVCPEFRWIAQGLEYADSFCFNPHKHLLTNFDCDAYYVKNRTELIRTMSVLPEYLKNDETLKGTVFDYRDWHVPLGRRFRALKLWFVIRHYGVEGLEAYIREHVRLAQLFAFWIESDDRFELCAPHPLNLVCFRLRASDEANKKLMGTLNASGDLFLTHTKLNDQFVLRMAIGSPATREEHVRAAWERLQAAADELR
jgi:aromatic-L-amino-acid decarboxylase